MRPLQSRLDHPYGNFPATAFWQSAIRETPVADFDPLLDIPFKIRRTDRVASAGSCFAQHLSRALIAEGIRFVQEESADDGPAKPRAAYSARYGNIYTTRQLRQLFRRAYGLFTPKHKAWKREDGHFVDPFRPTEFAAGFVCEDDVAKASIEHLAAVRRAFESCDVFVFTLGLTEVWIADQDGAAFPLPPGVMAAPTDPAMTVSPHNLSVEAMSEDLLAFIDDMRRVNPGLRFLLTVSPVPIIATFTGRHVLVSNTYTKAALRVVAHIASERRPDVLYFPSYEMIAAHPKTDLDRKSVV